MQSISLLILRLTFGLTMLLAHGWGKLENYAQMSARFPDPLGVSSPVSFWLTVFAEVLCAGLIVLGLATRLAAIPLMITMIVAICVVHGGDPWQKKEMGFLYLSAFTTLFFAGGGEISLSHSLKDNLKSSNSMINWLLK